MGQGHELWESGLVYVNQQLLSLSSLVCTLGIKISELISLAHCKDLMA